MHTAPTLAAETQAHSGDNEWTGYTICDSCNHMPMCGITFHAKGNTVIRIENWKEHPNHFLCSKGIATLQRLYNPNRLLYPLKRTNPKGSEDPGWVRIGWDEAIKMIAANLNAVKAKYGADRVLFYCGDPKEPRPPVMRLARYFESPNYGCESSVACNLAYVHAEELSYGQEIAGGPSPKTKCVMIVGKNGSWASPHGFFRNLLAQKARGIKLIVSDIRRTKVAEQADIHLQPKPGTDGALAWGMIRVLVKEGLVNQPFIDQWCTGYEELVRYAEKFTPDYVEKETGVKAEDVIAAARMFADGPSAMMLPGQSIPHQHNGCNNVRAYSLLMALTGNVDNVGGSSFDDWPKDYIRWDEGYTRTFIDQQWFNQPEQKAKRIDREFAPIWNEMQVLCSPNALPEMVEAGRIKAFAGFGANLLIWPDPAEYQEAVRNLDFSFATDYFYRDETHHDMDLVLPAAMNYERYAPFGVHGRKVSARKPVKPLGECWEDWKIALTIGAAVTGDSDRFFGGDPVKACDSMLNDWGTSYAERQAMLPNVNVCEWFPAPQKEKFAKGLLRFDDKPGFRTPSGKIEFFSSIQAKHGQPGLPVYVEPPKPTKDYPLKLINGTRRPYITHSKTRGDQPYLLELEPESVINMHPKDAQDRGLKEGDRVWMISPYAATKVRARVRVTILCQPGMVDAQYGWRGDQETQVMIPRKNWDPISGYPCCNDVCIEVVKADKEKKERLREEIAMSRFGIIVNVDKCVGCHACAIACKEENQVAPGIFYERVERFENIAANFINWFRVSCMQCDKPACMPVCPVKAIHRGPAGEVLVDQKKCIGCRMCERACPYGAPKFNASGETNYFGGKTPLAIRELEPWQRHAAGRAEHCTLCTHRTSQGRPPACVEACGIGAMTWVDFDAPAPEAEKLIAAAKPMNAAAGTEPKIRYVGRHLDAAAMSPRV